MTVDRPTGRNRPHAPAAARLRRQAARRRRRPAWRIGALALIGTAVAVTATLAGPSSGTGSAGAPSGHRSGALPDGYRLTGGTSPMGAPVIATPGTRTGTVTAGGVVAEGADIAMGRIPLASAVNPTWRLTNTGDQPVTLGKPRAEVVKGCCPGELMLGAATLEPGARTTLQFPLQMHPGMDGDHLFRIAVPVGDADALWLSAAGDFS